MKRPARTASWSIAGAATRLGTTIRTLRYYEESGLITPLRTASNARMYDRQAMARAERILDLRRAGLSTVEIAELDALDACQAGIRLEARLRARMAALDAERQFVMRILKRSRATSQGYPVSLSCGPGR